MLKFGISFIFIFIPTSLSLGDTYLDFSRKFSQSSNFSARQSIDTDQFQAVARPRKKPRSAASSLNWEGRDWLRIPSEFVPKSLVLPKANPFAKTVQFSKLLRGEKHQSPQSNSVASQVKSLSVGTEKSYDLGHLANTLGRVSTRILKVKVPSPPPRGFLPGPVSAMTSNKRDLNLTDDLISGVIANHLPMEANFNGRMRSSRISINESREQVFKTLAQEKLSEFAFDLEDKFPSQKTQINLQFIDERSSIKDQIIYPAPGLKVFVVGTGIVTETDPTGIVSLVDVPIESHFQIRIEDPQGEFAPAVFEVDTIGASESTVDRLFVYRDFALSNWMNMVGVSPDANQSSICGSFDFAKGAKLILSLDGPKGSGPFYFNSYGFVDNRQTVLSDDGKFCYFNVEPGAFAISLKDAVSLKPYSIVTGETFSGKLSTFSKRVVRGSSGSLKMGVVPPAAEQLSSHSLQLPLLKKKTVDGNFESMGLLDGIDSIDEGFLAIKNAVPSIQSRIQIFNHSPDYDDSFYSIEAVRLLDERNGLALLPRGFTEDMARYANNSFDRSKGHIYILDGGFSDLAMSKTRYELYSVEGVSVGNPWQYAEKPMQKSFFFNVAPGMYTLVAKQADQLIQMTTVMIFQGHTSIVNLGAHLQLRN